MSSVSVCRAKRQLDHVLRALAPKAALQRADYFRLVQAVRAKSSLLAPVILGHPATCDDALGMARALTRMAACADLWMRAPETWQPPRTRGREPFHSLAAHLFASYELPRFLSWSWFSRHDWHRELFLHVAAGRSVRSFAWPGVRPTRRVAKFFLETPDDLEPSTAYRYAQVRAEGGDAKLARFLATYGVLRPQTEAADAFWQALIRFFIANQPISQQEMGELLDFLWRIKFAPAELTWGRGAGQEPVAPDFCIRGRSLRSLRRYQAHWRARHADQFETGEGARLWQRSSISPFWMQRGEVIWTIDELLTDRELRAEGGILGHCVATYIYDCARRFTSIWSMRTYDGRRRKRELTIEVLPRSKTVFQARGKCNKQPSAAAYDVLRAWAEREGLRLGV